MFCDQQSAISSWLAKTRYLLRSRNAERKYQSQRVQQPPSTPRPISPPLPMASPPINTPFASPSLVRTHYTFTPQTHEHALNLFPRTHSTPGPTTPVVGPPSPRDTPSPPSPSQPTLHLADAAAPPARHHASAFQTMLRRRLLVWKARHRCIKRREAISRTRERTKKNLTPNRQWDDPTHHHVPGVSVPIATASQPQVPTAVVNITERTEAKQQTNNTRQGRFRHHHLKKREKKNTKGAPLLYKVQNVLR